MQTRHRIPSIFNLSMVDVLCCALGCVILLWLLYFREAKQRTEAAGNIGTQLEQTEKKLALRENDLKATRLELAVLRDSLSATEKSERRLIAELQKAGLQKDRLQGALAKSIEQVNDLKARELALAADVDRKGKESANQAEKTAAALKTIAALEKQLQEKQALSAAAAKQTDDLTGRLQSAENLLAKLAKEAVALKEMRTEQGAKMTVAESRIEALTRDLNLGKQALLLADRRNEELLQSSKKLEKLLAAREAELTRTGKKLDGLKDEARSLAARVNAAENRFAGVELKGERVLFVVDWSGSMRMKDSKTDDPSKWPMVCQTIGKLMSSLPTLKKYQVVLFSDAWSYPLGSKRKWLDFKGEASVKELVETLKSKRPEGGTNLADALKEGFDGFRGQGMDTIYLFSDGLPNAGPGLPANSDKLTESELNALCTAWLRPALKKWNPPGPNRVRINTIGFFFDSPEVGAFLWVLAREHEGSFVGMSKP